MIDLGFFDRFNGIVELLKSPDDTLRIIILEILRIRSLMTKAIVRNFQTYQRYWAWLISVDDGWISQRRSLSRIIRYAGAPTSLM